MVKPKPQSSIAVPSPFWKPDTRTDECLVQFLVGHFIAQDLSDEQKAWMNRLMSPAIDKYKAGSYEEANREVMYGWTKFRREFDQHLTGCSEGFEVDGAYISYFARRLLTERVDPSVLHEASIVNLHPWGYYIRCATYLLQTRDINFTRRLDNQTQELVFEYADMYDPALSRDLMGSSLDARL